MSHFIAPEDGQGPEMRTLPWWVTPLIAGVLLIGIVVYFNLPQYRHPNMRGRVSGTEAEQRRIGEALEAFRAAHGRLPTVREFYSSGRHKAYDVPPESATFEYTLTSPVAFIAALPGDPFSWDKERRQHDYFYFTDLNNCWILAGVGPNGKLEFSQGARNGFKNERLFAYGPKVLWATVPRACDSRFFTPPPGGAPGMIDLLYDPTNGLLSRGDVIKTGP